ncbi:hypothetical protein [Nocardia seriolae]|nr:hypothetical protein [Nocardia seriolae]OJF79456.1 hypothetical protein NS14008_09900 [Nocardia seriolae]QOW36633.1 hypothetical protein IMZ23_18340 [Nocardia seriolae]WNJ57110.1 hypothetical protein RMO66_27245 [Nocardia seriolae]BAW08449.1 conserved hypothetical protein [Nocardia seriolae]
MAREIINLIAGAASSSAGPLGVIGIYFGLLAVTITIGVVLTGIALLRRNPAVTAALGTHTLSARFHPRPGRACDG